MIVYFLKKSKKTYIQWGTALCLTLIILYMSFVFAQKLKNTPTIQYIKKDLIEQDQNISKNVQTPLDPEKGDYLYVASKKGTYYYPKNCSKAKALSIKNMLYFKDKTTAEGAGYKPHTSCF